MNSPISKLFACYWLTPDISAHRSFASFRSPLARQAASAAASRLDSESARASRSAPDRCEYGSCPAPERLAAAPAPASRPETLLGPATPSSACPGPGRPSGRVPSGAGGAARRGSPFCFFRAAASAAGPCVGLLCAAAVRALSAAASSGAARAPCGGTYSACARARRPTLPMPCREAPSAAAGSAAELSLYPECLPLATAPLSGAARRIPLE